MSFSQLEFNQQNSATTFITGDAGDIEVLITLPQTLTAQTPIAIISHPHPLYGGTMTNKVVHILAKTFSELNAITVRFNFRGVGKSQGEHDHGIGESDDLQTLVARLKHWRPESPIWLAGFSFGAYVTLIVQAKIKPERVVLVAPPVSMYDFEELDAIDVPWIVLQGGEDEVIDAAAVKSWFAARSHSDNSAQLVWMDDAGHFFHGKLNEVKARLLEAWPI